MSVRTLVTLVLLLLSFPALLWGDEICYVPSLTLNEQYNSNILMATQAGDVREDYITIPSLGFEMTDRTVRLDSVLSLQLDRLHYSRNDELDATNQHYSGSIRYSATTRLNVSVEAGYTKDFNPSLWSLTSSSSLPPTGASNTGGGNAYATTTLIPLAGDSNASGGNTSTSTPISTPPNSNTGGGNTSTSTTPIPAATNPNTGIETAPALTTLPLTAWPVERVSSSASMDYRMTEMTSLSAMYRFGWSSYEFPQYRDTSHDAQAGLVIDLGRYLSRVKGRFNTVYSQYLLPDLRTINVAGTIGFSYDVSETWSILADGGLRRTDSEIFINQLVPNGNQTPPTSFSVVEERLDHIERGGTGHVSLNYKGEYTSGELSYIQDFTMAYLASGYQAPAERKALSFTAQHQITRELSALLTAGYTTYTAARVLTQTNISISPVIRYDLVQISGERDLAIEASYDHTRIDYMALGTAYRDLFFIRLSIRFPYCSSSQYK